MRVCVKVGLHSAVSPTPLKTLEPSAEVGPSDWVAHDEALVVEEACTPSRGERKWVRDEAASHSQLKERHGWKETAHMRSRYGTKMTSAVPKDSRNLSGALVLV